MDLWGIEIAGDASVPADLPRTVATDVARLVRVKNQVDEYLAQQTLQQARDAAIEESVMYSAG